MAHFFGPKFITALHWLHPVAHHSFVDLRSKGPPVFTFFWEKQYLRAAFSLIVYQDRLG